MPEDPNHDAAAMAASKSPDQSTGGTVGTKHRKLIIFLILVLIFLIPLGGILFLSYTHKMSMIPFYSSNQ